MRKYMVQVFVDATGEVKYRHEFTILAEALTALAELHRDYKGSHFRITFSSWF